MPREPFKEQPIAAPHALAQMMGNVCMILADDNLLRSHAGFQSPTTNRVRLLAEEIEAIDGRIGSGFPQRSVLSATVPSELKHVPQHGDAPAAALDFARACAARLSSMPGWHCRRR